MPTPSLTPWLLVGLVATACGPEPPPDATQPDPSAQGGSGIVIASSDAAPTVGSTTSTASGADCCTTTASANAGSGGAPNAATACGTSTFSASNSGGVDGAGGEPSSSDATAIGGAGHDSGPSGAGGVGQDGGETGTGGEVPPPIPLGALLITEYVEGSSGSDKAIELSNVSSEPLALDVCQLIIYFNGKSTPGSEIALSAELLPGSSYTLCHSSSSPELMAHCDQATGSVSFNGDDALVLECDAIAHDGIGQVGVLPDDQWGDGTLGTKNQILRRRCGSTPRTDPTSVFDIVLDWVKVSDEGFAGLGDPACVDSELEEPAEF